MSLTVAQRRETMKLSSGDATVTLLRIMHASLPETLRICDAAIEVLAADPHRVGCTNNGDEYDFLPFEFVPPEDRADATPEAKISIPNFKLVDGTDISFILRGLSGEVTAEADVVMGSDPDNPILSISELKIVGAVTDFSNIEVTLTDDGLASEQAPSMSYGPSNFPALYR